MIHRKNRCRQILEAPKSGKKNLWFRYCWSILFVVLRSQQNPMYEGNFKSSFIFNFFVRKDFIVQIFRNSQKTTYPVICICDLSVLGWKVWWVAVTWMDTCDVSMLWTWQYLHLTSSLHNWSRNWYKKKLASIVLKLRKSKKLIK